MKTYKEFANLFSKNNKVMCNLKISQIYLRNEPFMQVKQPEIIQTNKYIFK